VQKFEICSQAVRVCITKQRQRGDSSFFAPPRGSQEPGSHYLYNRWDFNAAGYIIEKLPGLDVFDALRKELAEPLAMQDFDCTLLKEVADKPVLSNFPAHRMSFTTRDMARIGQLTLQDG
jgi:CubicO group peptidase (beta-lactamase class C family)